MAIILNIDTATEAASVSLSKDGTVIDSAINPIQKDHAAFIHTAIQSLLQKTGVAISDLHAIAVTEGPGSYTGLRVGMATAKGLCFALNIPLITINTLQVIALAAIDKYKDEKALYAALIDARRMEVFTAVYDFNLEEIISPSSIIINEDSFKELLSAHKIYFAGSGSTKLTPLLKENICCTENISTIRSLSDLSCVAYQKNNFSNLFYSTPFYLKEFDTNN